VLCVGSINGAGKSQKKKKKKKRIDLSLSGRKSYGVGRRRASAMSAYSFFGSLDLSRFHYLVMAGFALFSNFLVCLGERCEGVWRSRRSIFIMIGRYLDTCSTYLDIMSTSRFQRMSVVLTLGWFPVLWK